MFKKSLIVGVALLAAACVPISPEPPVAPTPLDEISDSCAPDHMTLKVGQSASDLASDGLPAFIDILRVDSNLEDNTLTAVFYLRNIPQEFSIDRQRASDKHQDYGWFVDIDIHGIVKDVYADYSLFDYTLRADNFAGKTNVDSSRTTRPFEDVLNPMLLEFEYNSGKDELSVNHLNGNARLHVSHEDNTLTLTSQIPGITPESTLLFWTFDILSGQDGIACLPG